MSTKDYPNVSVILQTSDNQEEQYQKTMKDETDFSQPSSS